MISKSYFKFTSCECHLSHSQGKKVSLISSVCLSLFSLTQNIIKQLYSTNWSHMHIGMHEPQGQNACIACGRNEMKTRSSQTKPARFTKENLGSKFISVKWTKGRHKRIVLAVFIVFLWMDFFLTFTTCLQRRTKLYADFSQPVPLGLPVNVV